jgi:hypothetical protein
MKGISRSVKVVVEVGIFLLLLLVFLLTIRHLGENNPTFAGAEIYPPPLSATDFIQPTPDLQVSPYPVPNEQIATPSAYQKSTFIGPTCLIDYSKQISLQLPEGWYGDINTNSINIVNYDPTTIQYEHGKPTNVPVDAIKIEIYDLKLKTQQTLEQWISAEKAQYQRRYSSSLVVGEDIPCQLGKYSGVAYSLTDVDGWSSKVIVLEVDTNRGIVVTIFPADSLSFSEALAILTSLNGSAKLTCREQSYTPDQAAETACSFQQIKREALATFECPIGVTFPGTEAKSSTIDLQMPFLWGQTWIVGGVGSFYGNYHHCNYYNNYYATD